MNFSPISSTPPDSYRETAGLPFLATNIIIVLLKDKKIILNPLINLLAASRHTKRPVFYAFN